MFVRSLGKISKKNFIKNLFSTVERPAPSQQKFTPFHLAFPVDDLTKTRDFYERVLECRVGRVDPGKWIDFDFEGHQISAHHSPEELRVAKANEVDGDKVPVRHFGLILEWSKWERLAEKLQAEKAKFIIEPHIRFRGEVGEQGTMFVLDPSGNALEFKTFKDFNNIFAY